ncbi:MAG: universal stress protein [Nitrospirota bacterium]|jgi:nucleotide-binding universal stress UspA family protein
MKKVLLAVDDSKGAKVSVNAFVRLFSSTTVETVILLNIQQPGGKTLIHDRLGDSEISTLKEELLRSGKQAEMDKNSKEILDSHRKTLEENGITKVKTVIKLGHVADEILKTAEEEAVDMIIIGATRTLAQKIFMGDVTRDVAHKAKVPVLLAR